MALDVLPSCSTHGSQLLDQLSARFTAASLFTGLRSSASSLCSSSSASGCGTGTGGQSSPPPMGGRAAAAASAASASVNHHFSRPNGASRQFDTTSNEFRYVQNAMAMAVLVRLHRWCCQLFWLTIVCLVGYCSDQQQRRKHRSGAVGSGCGAPTDLLQQQQHGRRTFHEVRKSIVHATQRRGTKTVTELEMQVSRSGFVS
uniref:Paired domain-containing protein n=1 Tax=Globodera pallida TaxID=36090 RepID=A0A183C7F2_GLOPA